MSKPKLTKADIVEMIFERKSITKKDLSDVVDMVFEAIRNAMADDKTVELRGFGTFEIRTRKGRQKARNPKTGELVAVETHGKVIFRPGREMKNQAWSLRAPRENTTEKELESREASVKDSP